MFTDRSDLFPETLAVQLVGGVPMTTSVEIATHFGKRHDTVLRGIKGLLNRTTNEGRRRNFAESSYLNGQGKRQPMYRLTRDGFAFVVGGFTGAEADEWKWRFIDRFNALEADLAAANARYLAALDAIRPSLRPVVKDFEDGLPRSDTALWLGKSPAAVTYHRSQARRLGLLPAVAVRRVAQHKR